MHWMSRVELNPQKSGGRKLIGSPQAMHAAVMASFPPGRAEPSEQGRVLWRIDQSNYQYLLYVVSHFEPDLTHIVEQAGWSTAPGETKFYDPFINRITLGQVWAFKLTANPVVSVKRDEKARGVVLPHISVTHQAEWLANRASKFGFEIGTITGLGNSEPVSALTVGRRENVRFKRNLSAESPNTGGRNVSLRKVQYEGTLRVTDADLLRNSLVTGIGRGKAYGCGLLTLSRTQTTV